MPILLLLLLPSRLYPAVCRRELCCSDDDGSSSSCLLCTPCPMRINGFTSTSYLTRCIRTFSLCCVVLHVLVSAYLGSYGPAHSTTGLHKHPCAVPTPTVQPCHILRACVCNGCSLCKVTLVGCCCVVFGREQMLYTFLYIDLSHLTCYCQYVIIKLYVLFCLLN